MTAIYILAGVVLLLIAYEIGFKVGRTYGMYEAWQVAGIVPKEMTYKKFRERLDEKKQKE